MRLAPLLTGFGLGMTGTLRNSRDVRSHNPTFASLSPLAFENNNIWAIRSTKQTASRISTYLQQQPQDQRLTMDATATNARINTTCRNVQESDLSSLLELANATGLFSPDELDELLGETLRGIFRGTLGKEHRARVIMQDTNAVAPEPAGWTYFAPSEDNDDESVGNSVYELYWIGVSPKVQRSGIGSSLLADCEALVRESGGNKLVISTSSTPATSNARAFYIEKGYVQSGSIVSDYYGPGDDKVTFIKSF